MSTFRFVRKNGKVLGPLTAERIEQLLTEQKLGPTDELAANEEGPWQSVKAVLQRIERREAEGEQGRAELSRSGYNVPPDAPDPFAGVPNFLDAIATPAAPITSPTFIPPSPHHAVAGNRNAVRGRSETANDAAEELDSTDPLRWIFPWKWETDTQPYPMLIVYIKLAKAVLIVAYMLFIVAGFLFLAANAIGIFTQMGEEGFGTSVLGLIVMTFSAVLWWLSAQLLYIAGMASIDLIRCFLAIERNTRGQSNIAAR